MIINRNKFLKMNVFCIKLLLIANIVKVLYTSFTMIFLKKLGFAKSILSNLTVGEIFLQHQ